MAELEGVEGAEKWVEGSQGLRQSPRAEKSTEGVEFVMQSIVRGLPWEWEARIEQRSALVYTFFFKMQYAITCLGIHFLLTF